MNSYTVVGVDHKKRTESRNEETPIRARRILHHRREDFPIINIFSNKRSSASQKHGEWKSSLASRAGTFAPVHCTVYTPDRERIFFQMILINCSTTANSMVCSWYTVPQLLRHHFGPVQNLSKRKKKQKPKLFFPSIGGHWMWVCEYCVSACACECGDTK